MAVRVASDRFGELVVEDDAIVELDDGLIGFVRTGAVAVLPVDESGVFAWLQDTADPTLAFLAVSPWPFFADYEPVLSDDDQRSLGLDDADDALVWCLVSGSGEPRRLTANLLGPLVVNTRSRKGRQVVLEGWPTQAPLPTPS